MIRVTFVPDGDGKHKRLLGRVEVDGVDISSRVTNVRFEASAREGQWLYLRLALHGDDVVDLEVPEEHLVGEADVYKPREAPVRVTAVGDDFHRYLRV